jgi:hypothetical protein
MSTLDLIAAIDAKIAEMKSTLNLLDQLAEIVFTTPRSES